MDLAIVHSAILYRHSFVTQYLFSCSFICLFVDRLFLCDKICKFFVPKIRSYRFETAAFFDVEKRFHSRGCEVLFAAYVGAFF